MPLVTMPDGTRVNMPDTLSAEQQAELEKLSSGPSAWQTVKESSKDLLRGAARGMASLIEGAANSATTNSMVDLLGLPKPKGMEAAPVTKAVNQVVPAPSDPSPSYRRAGLEGLGGALATGPTNLVTAAAGVFGGLGAEAGERLAGTPGAIAGGILGGVGGGTGAALATRPRPQTALVARELQEGWTTPELYAAQKFRIEAKKQGVNIDLAQALAALNSGNSGNFEGVRNFLAGHVSGNETQRMLRNQPKELAIVSELTARNLPGRNLGQDQNANFVQQTASKVYEDAKKARSNDVRGLYAKAGDITPEQRDQLVKLVQADIAQPGTTEILKARGEDFIRKLTGSGDGLEGQIAEARKLVASADTPAKRVAARVQLAKLNAEQSSRAEKAVPALDVDTAIGEFAKKFEAGNPLKVADPKATGQVKGLAGKLNKQFQEMSPEVKAAEQRYAYLTERDVAPLKQGPVGTLNQPGGFNPETQAQVSKFQGLMDAGTETMTDVKVSRIGTAAKELAKADPAAFEGAFKGWFAKKIDEAKTPGAGESPLPTVDAAKLWDSVFGDSKRWQGVQDATAAMARVRGEKPENIIRGLNHLRQLTAAVKMRPSQIGGMSSKDLARIGGSSNLADAARVFSYLPAGKFAQRLEDVTLRKTLQDLDKIMTSDAGVDMLIKLGKTPVMSRKAQVILGTWGAGVGNSRELTIDNPSE